MGRWWRRRAERRVAAKLLQNAILEIRMYAAKPQYYAGSGTAALQYIHMLADTVENLPGGLLAGGERRDAWPGKGYHTFYEMWATAPPERKCWLAAQFSAMGYDHAYLDQAPRWPVYKPPAVRLSWRRGGIRIPREVTSVKAVNTQTFARLEGEAYERGLAGSKRPDWLIAHLALDATHILLPKRPDEVFFGPKVDGVWEYRCLLRMCDGAIVVASLRAERRSIDAVPAGLTRREQFRIAALPRGRDRDVYLWSRDHRAAESDCDACAATIPPDSA